MARLWLVVGCAGVMLLGLALPTAAEEAATLSGLKSTKSAELGDVRGSVVEREKTVVSRDSSGQPRQTTERVTDPLGKAEDEFSGPDYDVTQELRDSGAGAGLTSGVGGAYGSDLRGFTAPLVRSVNPNR